MQKEEEIRKELKKLIEEEKKTGNSKLKNYRISPRRWGRIHALMWVLGIESLEDLF